MTLPDVDSVRVGSIVASGSSAGDGQLIVPDRRVLRPGADEPLSRRHRSPLVERLSEAAI
jgi:hypothetical protein